MSVGTFAAECRARVTARIQIEQSGQLLVLLLISATVLAVLVGISPVLLLAVELVGAAWSDWAEPGLASP